MTLTTRSKLAETKEEAIRFGAIQQDSTEKTGLTRYTTHVEVHKIHFRTFYAPACSLYDKKECLGDALWEEDKPNPKNWLFNRDRAPVGVGCKVYLLDCFNYGRVCDKFQQRPKVSLRDYVCPTGEAHPYNVQRKMALQVVQARPNGVFLLRSEDGIETLVSNAQFAWVD